MDEQRQWHRLFGMSWVDFFTGLPVTVEVEKDLSVQQQLIDVVLVRKGPGPLPVRLPDGLEDLAGHNLISFKSHRQTLDGWALNELVGHYVSYRKLISPTPDQLVPEDDFRLFAVCVRFPANLAGQLQLAQRGEGVYEVQHFSGPIRLVVVHQLPQTEHNALLHLFSARLQQIAWGAEHYRPRSGHTSQFLGQLLQGYQTEGVLMPFDQEQFWREAEENLQKMLRSMPVGKRLEGIPVEKRLEGVSVDELIKGLDPQTLEALKRRLQADDTARPQP